MMKNKMSDFANYRELCARGTRDAYVIYFRFGVCTARKMYLNYLAKYYKEHGNVDGWI